MSFPKALRMPARSTTFSPRSNGLAWMSRRHRRREASNLRRTTALECGLMKKAREQAGFDHRGNGVDVRSKRPIRHNFGRFGPHCGVCLFGERTGLQWREQVNALAAA